MAVSNTSSVRWTIADLADLPEDNSTRYEIIEGELRMSKDPHWHHQRACSKLTAWLINGMKRAAWARGSPVPGSSLTRRMP